jgi:hypothetical protein
MRKFFAEVIYLGDWKDFLVCLINLSNGNDDAKAADFSIDKRFG